MRTEVLPGGIYPQISTCAEPRSATPMQGCPSCATRCLQKGVTPETYSPVRHHVLPRSRRRAARRKGIALLPYHHRGQLIRTSMSVTAANSRSNPPPTSAASASSFARRFDAAGAAESHRRLPRRDQRPRKAGEGRRKSSSSASPGGTRLSLQGLGINGSRAARARSSISASKPRSTQSASWSHPAKATAFCRRCSPGVQRRRTGGARLRHVAPVGLHVPRRRQTRPRHRHAPRCRARSTSRAAAGARARVAMASRSSPASNLKFDLGPMKAVAENIGLRSTLRFSPAISGPRISTSASSRPPASACRSTQAGSRAAASSGSIRANGEYAGALELDFKASSRSRPSASSTRRCPTARRASRC